MVEKTFKDLEKELQLEYKKKLNEIKKIKQEKEAVGQVFTKGILPLYVYYILTLGPSNGNDIATKIGEHTRGRWCPSTGGIYPLLKKMERDGFIKGEIKDEGRFQKLYSLTKEGLEEYDKKKDLLKDRFFDALEVFKMVARKVYNEDEGK